SGRHGVDQGNYAVEALRYFFDANLGPGPNIAVLLKGNTRCKLGEYSLGKMQSGVIRNSCCTSGNPYESEFLSKRSSYLPYVLCTLSEHLIFLNNRNRYLQFFLQFQNCFSDQRKVDSGIRSHTAGADIGAHESRTCEHLGDA